MILEITEHRLIVKREETDLKYYGTINAAGESKLLYAIKKQLNAQGYDLIKKRMWHDGHLVDDMQQYLRTRKKGSGKADIQIYNPIWAIRGANDDFNNGEVILTIDQNIFEN